MANLVKINKKFTTPVGELKWIFTTGNGKLADADDPSKGHIYTATLVLHKDDEKCKKLQSTIDEVWEEFKSKNNLKPATKPKSLGYKPEKDPDTDEELDTVAFQFKTNTTFPDGTPIEIRHLDAQGNPMNMKQPAGNGSIGVIFGTAAGYEYKNTYGISLYLRGIQFALFKPFTGNDVDASEVQDLSAMAAEYAPTEYTEAPDTDNSAEAPDTSNTPPI